MQIHQLRYFISVAEHLNFTEAAKQLFVAQSAVSQQIANLETKIGVQLFLRNKRSVQLTNAGTVFLKEAIEIVQKMEGAVEKARKAEAGFIGSLQIGFLAAPVRRFLPHLIKSFNGTYPHVEIQLHHFNLGQLNEKLKHNELDVVFAISLGFQDIKDLESKTLFSSSSCVYLHREHPLAGKSSIHLADLALESYVMRDREEAPQWYDYALTLCAKSGFFPNIVSHAERIETVLMFVDAGIGITILPNYLEMYASPSIRIIPIEGEKDILDVAVYRNLTNQNPTIPLFLDQIQSMLHQGDFSSLS
jgi:DNA-binding transcriptional LysR family regulator